MCALSTLFNTGFCFVYVEQLRSSFLDLNRVPEPLALDDGAVLVDVEVGGQQLHAVLVDHQVGRMVVFTTCMAHNQSIKDKWTKRDRQTNIFLI